MNALPSLRTIARALGGEVSGAQVLAPGPGHARRDRSLVIRLSPRAPDGFVLYSHAGNDWRECRDYVRERLGLPAWGPGDDRHEQRSIPSPHLDTWDFAACNAESNVRPRTEDDLVRIARTIKLWDEGVDPRGTAAERYLQARALALPEEIANTVLRYHARCPWRDENTGRTAFIPCMLAAFRSIDDGDVTAVHRIRLDQPARWPKTERRMLGVVQRAAAMLDPAADILAVGEGIETCMAARELGLGPAWALGSVGAISFFPVLDGIKRLTILAETGEASSRMVQICGQRWRSAGCRVTVSRSRIGSDHNDILMQKVHHG